MNKKLYNKNYKSVPVAEPEVESVEARPAPTKTKEPIKKGSKVKFTGTKTYSGIPLDISKTDIFSVVELSGDRAVIGKGTRVIAAVNIKDCKKVG